MAHAGAKDQKRQDKKRKDQMVGARDTRIERAGPRTRHLQKRRSGKIAASLKRSAEKSKRRKSGPYRSAMSMLTFYINRAGKARPEKRRRVLERAKDALRKEFSKG